TRADVNVNAPVGQAPTMAPPVRTNDQILPHIRWMPIGKSNCYLDIDKSQSNPIYKIAVDLLKHTNFFRAFTTSSTIPSIYIQQFWDTVQYDKSTGCYRCQLDEQLFVLTKDTLREALQITPVNNNQAFIYPPSSDALINFVNELGYPKLVRNLSNVVTNDMFQPRRELTTIINLCLTGKTFGFERPRAPVLQFLWGVVTRAHIDYAERIWEEFTQSIHTLIDDKRNLAQHTSGKKKATLIMITSIQFTKLIIYHLQRQHKFHLRHDSSLHLPNEEHVLGYLKFSAKGIKKEVFRMTIPGSLIIADIQEALYYQKYLAKVAKHQRYLAGETGSDPDSPTSKPTKPARKPKSMVDADMQRAFEESLKSMYDVPRGPLPPVVIKEPESRKYQPLPEVPRKGKEKRRTSIPTGSSEHDESSSLYAELGLSNSEEESQEVVPGADAGGQGQAGSNPDEQSEGQAGPDPGNAGADEQPMPSPVVHAGSDHEHMDLNVADVSPQPSTEQMDEGFTATAYPKVQKNLKLTVKEHVLLEEPPSSSGTLSSLQHLSKDLSFDMSLIPPMTSPIIDLTSRPESPKVHQQLKPTAADTTTTTTTTLPPPPYQQQSTAEAMMMKRIGELEHIMANLIQDNKGLEQRLDSHGAHWAMQAPLRNRFRDLPEANMKKILDQRMWETNSYKSLEDHMQLYEALENSMNRDHSEELAKDLAEARKKKKKSRESPKMPPGSPPHQSPPPPLPAGPSGASGASRAFGSSQVMPPPPQPPSTNQEGPSKGSAAPSSSKIATSAEYQAWMTTNIRLRPSISLTPADLQMDEDMALDKQAQSSDDEDIGSAHIPKVNLRKNCPAFEIIKVFHPDVIHLQYQMEECQKLLTDSVDDPILRHNVSKLLPLGGPPGHVTIQSDFFFNKDLEYLRYGSKGSRPTLSISKMKATYYLDVGLEQMVPDQFWIEEECKYDIAAMYGISHWWFQRQRFYIDRHTSKADHIAVRTHMWILSVVRIKVFSMYGYDYMKKIVLCRADLNEHVIAERDFKYLYPSDFEDLYLLNLQGHLNQLPPKDKKILTTAVNQWTRYLVIRQRVEDFQLGIESYPTQLNLTKPRWNAAGFEYKHDYIVIDSLRAVTCRDRYVVQMMMRFNEIHKFSDGTLQQIDEALDYRVKEFQINRMNLGLNTRFWTRKDVDRSKAFMFAIQKRLKTRRIFRNLESFVVDASEMETTNS
nr:monodehydroascorbate reductase [Tanacetum cinerariifolium]